MVLFTIPNDELWAALSVVAPKADLMPEDRRNSPQLTVI